MARAHERGSTLIGQLVALAIIGIAFVILVGSLSTSSMGVRVIEDRVSGENLARQQMEMIKVAPYALNPTTTPYPTISTPVAQNYRIAVTITYWDGSAFVPTVTDKGLQLIQVEVRSTRQGDQNRVFILEDYKGERSAPAP